MGQINMSCGTNVDMHFIWVQDGAQWLRGYAVLRGKAHVNVMRSGLTIATGCDLGAKDETVMKSMGYQDPNDPVLVKLRPYLGEPFIFPHGKKAFKDMTGSEVSLRIAKLGPIPVLTKAEADLLDVRSFISQINNAALSKRLLAATRGQRPQNQSRELQGDDTTLAVDPPQAAPADIHAPGNLPVMR